ncbi:MAG: BamA/TamA family outer membrane protein [Labilithrix sp.]|nr:BamA/TamA family outer membrane protein [Labilithrix sp.]MCW5816945.1 BamA/TamA family outer membrane protein [Labilithrix sp.]
MRSRTRIRKSLLVLALAALGSSREAAAAPLKTWGADPPAPPENGETPADVAPPPPPPPPPTPDRADDLAPPIARADRPVGPGGLRYVLEGVEVRGNTTTLARVILRYVPFQRGAVLDVDDKELVLTRFRLLGTGFFRDVQLSLRRGTKRGYVVLVVDVVERNTILVNDLWLGLSADAEPDGRARPLTAFGGIDVSEQNLAGTGVALGGAIAMAERQLALRTRVSDPSFLRSSWLAEAQLLFNNAKDFFGNRDVLVDVPSGTTPQDYALASYRRFGGLVGFGHELGRATRGFLDYRLEKIDAQLPAAASHKRGRDIEPIDFDLARGSTILSTIGATIVHDTRDEPFLPTRGWHVLGHVETSLTPLGSDYPYTKLVLRASRWIPLPWEHVIRIEGIFGSVFGDAPLFEKFYVGDYTDLRPHRALDLAFDRRAAPNFFGTTIAEVRYGDYAARLTGEYRVPIYRGRKTIYGVDVFGGAGFYAVANKRDLIDHARGYSGIQTIPFDFTFNLGLRADTAIGGLALGIANYLGFIPIRSGTQ